jgi:biopolymer transport protein ExbD
MPASHATHPNVTPLIDVVMCLIIFFMLVARIGINTGAEKMDLPASIQGVDITDMGNTLTLNIWPGRLDQPLVSALVENQQQDLPLREPNSGRNILLDTLRHFRYGADRKPGGTGKNIDNENFKVIIRGGEDLAYRYLEPVLLTCAEANVANVNFNTEKMSVVTGH